MTLDASQQTEGETKGAIQLPSSASVWRYSFSMDYTEAEFHSGYVDVATGDHLLSEDPEGPHCVLVTV